MNLLIYAAIYEGMGTGNLVRMSILYNYILDLKQEFSIDFSCNNHKNNYIIPDIKIKSKFQKKYDVILIDDPLLTDETIDKFTNLSTNIIAFDTFNYNSKLSSIINLINHYPERAYGFKGKTFDGVKFAIIKEEIIKAKIRIGQLNAKKKVLITFGGEDPNSNTLKVLKKINSLEFDITVIVGKINKDREKIKKNININIVDHTNRFGQLLHENDIIICGGGTTLLEALYIGNPIIPIPQNSFEKKFIDNVKEGIELFQIENIRYLNKSIMDKDFRKKLKIEYKNKVDGKGLERIVNIIVNR